MTDKGDTKGNAVLRALSLRPKVQPIMPANLTEEQMHDEAVKYAITASNQLRAEREHFRQQAEQTNAEYAEYKQDAVEELRVQKHEYESKLNMLRATLDARERQLEDTGRKLEHYHSVAHELATKFDDFEKFYMHELRVIRDTANHMAVGLVTGINNATAALTDAAKHSADGLVKQVENSATNMAAFIDDIRAKREAGEYRPKTHPMQEEKLKPLAPDAEEALADLVQKIKAKPTDVAGYDDN